MRCFVLITLLATAAYADVSHVTGYTYGQGSSGQSGGLVSHGGLSGFNGDSTGFSGGLTGLSGGLSGFTGGSTGFTGGSLGSIGGSSGSLGGSLGESILSGGGLAGLPGFSTGSSGHHHHHQQHHVEAAPVEVEFVKEFYTFDAPQEEYQENESLQRTKESLKKNLQVIFIKTPESKGIEHAAISLAKSASESKSAIYILQKQPDVSEFSNQLQLIHTHNAHKPEVHFVKYRTPEEAQSAQQTIQQQYEHLGGTSLHKHGGVPQVLNYASSNYAPGHMTYNSGSVAPGSVHHTIGGVHQTYHPDSGSISVSGAPSQKYLPVTA